MSASLSPDAYARLFRILRQPTAPFREKHVLDTLTDLLATAGVPHFVDPAGNLIVGADSQADYLALVKRATPSAPIRFFIAHTDHPGFHGLEWRTKTELTFKWHGGAPHANLVGAPVWLSSSHTPTAPDGAYLARGEILSADLVTSTRSAHGQLGGGVIRVNESAATALANFTATSLWGGFRFREPAWESNGKIYTKAADDLVGAHAIVELALSLYGTKMSAPGDSKSKTKSKSKSKTKPKKRFPFIGLLSRAEEVGFIGAIAHFELGWLAKRQPGTVIAVSLETSRQLLPGAKIGSGPVVRLGDRAGPFDAAGTHILSKITAILLPDRHQRRIMDGGSCEATAALVYGLPAIGISVPLGNYHNQSFEHINADEGGPDSRGPDAPAPEFVALADVVGLRDLCHGLVLPPAPAHAPSWPSWKDPFGTRRHEFKKSLASYRSLMRSGP